jgi:putative ABC transport system permease protein
MILKIAWRNIWRNKKRSLTMILAICFGMWAGILMLGFMQGMLDQMINTSINSRLSHIQIHHPEYKKEEDLKYHIKSKIHGLEDQSISGITKRLIVNGMISTSYSNRGIKIIAVNPEDEKQVTNIEDYIKDGTYLKSSEKNQIILSQKLAKKLNIKLRKKVILNFQDIKGDISSAAFRVTGLFNTNNAMIDDQFVFIAINDLEPLVSSKNIINEVLIKLKNNELLETTLLILKEKNPLLLIQSWKEIDPYLKIALESNKQQFAIFVAIIMIALGFGILNTMLMSVLERIKEIGTLLSIGMRQNKIFKMVLLETICLSFISGLIGLLFSIVSVNYFAESGLDLSVVAQGLAKFGLSSYIYPVVDFTTYFMFFIFIIITAVISAIYPALKAIRLKPNEALHYL